MKQLVILLALLPLACLTIAAKPLSLSGFTFGHSITYGVDGNPTDGCLGWDERLTWGATGDLMPGETATFTYPVGDEEGGAIEDGSICPSNRWIRAESGNKGRDRQILITIHLESYATPLRVMEVTGINYACLDSPWGYMGRWWVSITNLESRVVRDAGFSGINNTNYGQAC